MRHGCQYRVCMCAGVLAAFPVFPSRPITVSRPTICPHFTKLSFKCIYSCSFHLNCLILPNQVYLFDSKWVIRSFIKDRLQPFNDSFADLLFNPLFRSGYSCLCCNFPLKHINAKRPSWRKRCPWQSKYLHRYYVFIKFSFSPSKVTKIFLSLSSSFFNFIVLFVLLVLIHIFAVITITYVKIKG